MSKPIRGTNKAPKVDGPRYRVTAKSWIDGRMVGPGEHEQEITYLGVPGSALEPLNEAATAAVAAARKVRAARKAAAGDTADLAAQREALSTAAADLAAQREAFAKEQAEWVQSQLNAAPVTTPPLPTGKAKP